ncbi:hypothetical protein D1007_58151 [Hordeum vulgare]|nr:hypothetical protein D1007_58151 [Hordeum vulgare]
MDSRTSPQRTPSDPGTHSSHCLPKAATQSRRKINFDEEDVDFIPEESVPQKKKEKTIVRKNVRKEYATPDDIKALEVRLAKKAGQKRDRKGIVHAIGRPTSMYEDPAKADDDEEEQILAEASDYEIWYEGKNLLRTIGKGTLLAPTYPNFAPLDEYMAEQSACGLWTALKQKYTVKPRVEAEWIRLRFANFKTVGVYNSALHRICTTLQLCGTKVSDRQKIEKTLSTFYPDAVQSSWNYCQGNYMRYSELIDVLQVGEAYDECRAPQEVVAAYKVRKDCETHLALVEEESALAPPASPVMILTPPPVPIVATSAVPIAAALAVSNDADVSMEVEHTVAPTVPPLDVDAATKMTSRDEGITSLKI